MDILDFLNEDEIINFASQTILFENSKKVETIVKSRTKEYLIACVKDEQGRRIVVKITNLSFEILYLENMEIDLKEREELEQDYWQAYLYWLFKEEYFKYIKERIIIYNTGDVQDFVKQNTLRNLELKYNNLAILKWPYLEDYGRERRLKK